MDSQVIEFLQSKQISVIKEDIDTKLKVWEAWYKGHVDGFHKYQIYGGKKKINKKRRTLNMAQRVCQDWADLLLNEKVKITIADKHTQEVLNQLLHQINFFVKGNNLIEAAFAKGGGIFIQYFDGKKVSQKYVTQDFMYPISFDSGKLTEAAFASEKTIKGKKYVYLETHLTDENGKYYIENFLLEKGKDSLEEVSESFYEENEIDTIIETDSPFPSFQMIRPNVANKDNFTSPFGTSVLSGATDVLEGVDIAYDTYISELVLGRKRIFARNSVTNFHIGKDGETIEVFDPNDEVFYLLPGADKEDAPPIIESNMQLRIPELDTAMQTQLNLLSQAVGFGANGYKWENGNVSTATQIISENSKMFRTLKKHEEILRQAIIDMSHSLLNFQKKYGDKDTEKIKPELEITVDFDDSIIEDTAEKKRQAMLEYNAGLIDAVEYYVKAYNMSKEQAQKYYEEIQKRQPEKIEDPEGT